MLSNKALSASKSVEPVYIEDVFSTYLYTGNSSTQTITNGIDLAGEGGLTWIKVRSTTYNNILQDTVRGYTSSLKSNNTDAAETISTRITGFLNNGFSIGSNANVNASGETYCSWTFREQAKFFDVVTYTGDGTTNGSKVIPHNLGSTPGMIIVKSTSNTSNWMVWHRVANGGTSSGVLQLNNTVGTSGNPSTSWFPSVTSTNFSVAYLEAGTNDLNNTYVAYLFAHDAGGFGDAGTDNIISCGSFTTDSNGDATVTLNYEPQYVLVKRTNGGENWYTFDTMRGWDQSSSDRALNPNLSDAEFARAEGTPTATGFTWTNGFSSSTYIYMAIRRGPMKTPTSGTQVFSPFARAGTGSAVTVSGAGFAPDLFLSKTRNATIQTVAIDRLRGGSAWLGTASTSAESPDPEIDFGATMNGLGITTGDGIVNSSSFTYIQYMLKRFPGFMDVVCYTGTATSNRAINHNLGVAPELTIIKKRSGTGNWYVGSSVLPSGKGLFLDSTLAQFDLGTDGVQSVSSTTFTVSTPSGVNASGDTYIAYLFATVAGVSKVGSYTGTGSTQTINAGLPTGARFILIKRTDSTGNWWVWDTARGMVAGTDPRLALNSTAAELNNNWVYTVTNGFQIVTSDATVNANGGTYIYLAIA